MVIITQKIRHSKDLGKNLRFLRIEAGLTQEETIIKMELMGLKRPEKFTRRWRWGYIIFLDRRVKSFERDFSYFV